MYGIYDKFSRFPNNYINAEGIISLLFFVHTVVHVHMYIPMLVFSRMKLEFVKHGWKG